MAKPDKIETPPPAPKPRRLMGLVVKLLAAVLLLAMGFGGGYVAFSGHVVPTEEVRKLAGMADAEPEADKETPKPVAKPTPDKQEFVTSYYEFPDILTTNLKDTTQILQVKVGVATHYDAKVIENVTANSLALKSDILSVISGFGQEDIAGKEGRDRLANALRDAINARLTELTGFGGIESVYFSSFIQQ